MTPPPGIRVIRQGTAGYRDTRSSAVLSITHRRNRWLDAFTLGGELFVLGMALWLLYPSVAAIVAGRSMPSGFTALLGVLMAISAVGSLVEFALSFRPRQLTVEDGLLTVSGGRLRSFSGPVEMTPEHEIQVREIAKGCWNVVRASIHGKLPVEIVSVADETKAEFIADWIRHALRSPA
ncbi:MAG: hypothetical protein AAF938_22340 [Myxococcota bacterium]